jgi:hypothetical protein
MKSDRKLLRVTALVFTLERALSAQTRSITGTVKDTEQPLSARRWLLPLKDAPSCPRWTLTFPVTPSRPRSQKELTTLS